MIAYEQHRPGNTSHFFQHVVRLQHGYIHQRAYVL